MTKIKVIELNLGGVGECQLCGKQAELRPYGPHGQFICFDCGMKDEEATRERMKECLKKVVEKHLGADDEEES